MVSSSGFMLGIVGALVDFASATTILVNQGSGPMMNSYMLSGDAWAAVLLVLGAALVVTSVMSVTLAGVGHLKAFSLLMIAFGIVMAVIGSLMSSGSIEGSSQIFNYGMVIVGVLMAVDGVVMLRTPMPA